MWELIESLRGERFYRRAAYPARICQATARHFAAADARSRGVPDEEGLE